MVTALMPSLLFPLFLSFSSSFKNSSVREKIRKLSSFCLRETVPVDKLSSFWDWWAASGGPSLFVSIIVAKYSIFLGGLTMAAREAICSRYQDSVRYGDLEHAYVY